MASRVDDTEEYWDPEDYTWEMEDDSSDLDLGWDDYDGILYPNDPGIRFQVCWVAVQRGPAGVCVVSVGAQ